MTTLPRACAALSAVLLTTGLTACGGPTAEEVQREHGQDSVAAQQEILADLEALSGVGELVGESVHDSCRTGQHNWKIDDPYDVVCEVAVHQAYRITATDFRAAADSVTEAFPECPDSEAEAVLRDYWDELEGTTTRNFRGPYRPDNLPEYRLDCPSAGNGTATGGDATSGEVRVTGWATLPVAGNMIKRHEFAMRLPCSFSTEETPCRWEGVTAEEVLTSDESDEGWIVFVVGNREYART